MMIQVNLLPGAKKQAAGRTFSLGSVGALTDRIRDPWLIGAAASVIVAIAAVGVLFTTQQARAAEVDLQMDRAVRDSTRYAKVLDARHKLSAERDSVQRQLQIIRTIDDNRYNWAHLLDEVSRALPAYTWLTTIEQTSKVPVPPGADTTRGLPPVQQGAHAAAEAAKKAAAAADSIDVHPELTFRVVGQTVDIQALTMFMRQLENSPFVQNVSLLRSEIVVVDGKDVTQFELSAAYEVPAPGIVRTAPLVIPVR